MSDKRSASMQQFPSGHLDNVNYQLTPVGDAVSSRPPGAPPVTPGVAFPSGKRQTCYKIEDSDSVDSKRQRLHDAWC